MVTQPPDEYMDIDAVAEHYHTTAPTVRYWIHTGYGPRSVKIGRRRLFPVAEVAAFDRRQLEESGVSTP